MTGRLHDATIALGPVGLSVADLGRSLAFYQGVLGLSLLEAGAGRAVLGTGERPLVLLEERPGARRDPEAADLFHFALLLPSRAALGRQLAELTAQDVPLTGAADHHVSEAVYLDDPDGHGIELYRDRSPDGWRVDGRMKLTNDRLDLAGILAEGERSGRAWDGLDPGTVMGHVHLQSCNLGRSGQFYRDRLGFDVTAAWPHATFLSVAGYHHHLAVNDWRGRRRPAAPDDGGIGLLWYEIAIQDGTTLDELADALPDAQLADGTLTVTDPSGIPIRITAG